MRFNLSPDITLEQLYDVALAMMLLRKSQNGLYIARTEWAPPETVGWWEREVKQRLDRLWEAQQRAA